MTLHPVAGFRLAAECAGIKKAQRRDLVLMALGEGSRTAAVFTQNRFCAAPVVVAKRHLAQTAPKYLLVNTGVANAGTGQEGEARALRTCELVAEAAGCKVEEVLPFSTGVIGELFELAPFEAHVPAAHEALRETAWAEAAEGVMTTDTRPKAASRQLTLQCRTVTIKGLSKGAGMIKPNMATMLAFIATDAALPQAVLEDWVVRLADTSFNCISVDGDTSTNDACVLTATGGSGVALQGDEPEAQQLYEALEAIFVELAQAIVRDGEGATKFITIEVEGAATQADAKTVAETVAHSPLVKTALFASDPNWGRILAAVGRAPIAALQVDNVSIWLGNVAIVERGAVAPHYTEEAGAKVMQASDITIRISLGEGAGQCTLWTCDFSYDYVKINAEYRS